MWTYPKKNSKYPQLFVGSSADGQRRIPRHYLLRRVVLLLILELTIVTGMVVYAKSTIKQTEISACDNHRAVELIGMAMYYDEALKMSAKMAAATGDLKWEKRYKNLLLELKSTVQEAVILISDGSIKAKATQAELINIEQAVMENQAFELIRQGKRQLAFELLQSDEYNKQEHIDSGDVAEFLSVMQANVQTNHKRRSRLLWSTFIFISIVILMAPFSLFILFQMRKNLSECKKAEERLRQERNFSQSIIETAQAIMLILDNKANIVTFNPYMEQLSGYRLEEVKGKNWFEVFLPQPDQQKIQKQFKDAINGMQTKGYVNPIITKQNSWIDIEWYDKVLKDSEDKVISLLAIGQDVTERKKAEAEKEQLHAHLRQSQKMEAVGTLAGGIAHDFNNILMVLTGYAELAMDDIPTNTVAYNNLQQVLASADRAKELVKQILTFCRKTGQKKKPTRIDSVVKDALQMLRSSIPTTVEIQQDIESDSSVIMANSTQIHQVLINLCTNAVHAMEHEGGGLLQVNLTGVDMDSNMVTEFGTLQEGAYAKLTVQDTGCGMNNEILGRIFEPFFTTKEVDKGTGMGLSVVHGIVENHNGVITVQSWPGQGTIFSLFFPRIEASEIQEIAAPEIIYQNDKTILLVDDEKNVVDIMAKTLQCLGYSVVTETSSVNALEIFKAKPEKFDMVITDYVMPVMNGTKLAAEVMNIRADIPIILCTGFSEEINAEKVRDMGIKELIMKPIDRTLMAATIHRVLTELQTVTEDKIALI